MMVVVVQPFTRHPQIQKNRNHALPIHPEIPNGRLPTVWRQHPAGEQVQSDNMEQIDHQPHAPEKPKNRQQNYAMVLQN